MSCNGIIVALIDCGKDGICGRLDVVDFLDGGRQVIRDPELKALISMSEEQAIDHRTRLSFPAA